MKTFFATLLIVALSAFTATAHKFSYKFSGTPISKALLTISKDHPDANLSFIYKELDNYLTSAHVQTDNLFEALRQTVGLNPISVFEKDNLVYVEAFQHGKYIYTGRLEDTAKEPLVGATVMLLAPSDSTVITYGVTDNYGRFMIPCDSRNVIAKITCIGYLAKIFKCSAFNLGTITLSDQPFILNTVKVEGESSYALQDRTVFLPTARQKDSSSGAIDLLSQMAIPQIQVDPINKSIKIPGGGNVSVFIDYVAATTQDLSSMNTTDVKKVEFYAFSHDPRFKGANYVINFIMNKYEWGGYTRLNADQWFSIHRTEGSVYSKFVYKKMTFDIFANEIYFSNRHRGANVTELFRFTDLKNSGPAEITRKSSTDKSRYNVNLNDLSFRAVYSDDKSQFANSLGITFQNTPHEDMTNTVRYSTQDLTTETSENENSSKDLSLTYTGDYYRQLSEAVSLQSEATYTYAHNDLNSTYRLAEKPAIVNDATENIHAVTIAPRLEWTINDKHYLSFSGDGRWKHHLLNYTGNSPSIQTYNILVGVIGAGYDISLEKTQLGASFSWAWEKNNIAGFKLSNSFPVFEFHGVYTPNRKNQLQLLFNLGRQIPNAVNKSPNMLQQDELMWYTGSPDLRDNSTTLTRLTYTFLPNNRFQLGFNSHYYLSRNRVAAVYTPNAPDGTMLRKYTNSGNYHCAMFGLSGTVKLLGNNLVLNGRPQLWLRESTGDYSLKNTDLVFQASATYYFGKFSLFGYYCTPSKYIEEENGYVERNKSVYLLSLGWHKGPLHVGIEAYNFLHTSWSASKKTLTSQYYDFSRTDYDTDYHQRFSINVRYTFNYGRKVNTRDEVSSTEKAESAILK